MHDKGVKIRLGTDMPEGGESAIAEQRLLFEHGFSIGDIIKICTINGAEALGIEKKFGSIEKGKKANLVIYEKNPFDDYRNFSAERTVIKDGVVYKKK
jgi:imidazolonepropionase-like amidohydrolase